MKDVAKRFVIKAGHNSCLRVAVLFIAFAEPVLATEEDELTRKSVFDSVGGFVTAIKAFQPSAGRGELASLFTIPEMGTDNHGKPIAASAIESCDTLWSDEKSALLFATATPPTIATPSHVGLLFLLVHQRDGWRITDVLRFTATGKDSGVSAEQTAFAPIRLGADENNPVVTVNEHQGGRGYAYGICASYKLAGSKLKRLDLE